MKTIHVSGILLWIACLAFLVSACSAPVLSAPANQNAPGENGPAEQAVEQVAAQPTVEPTSLPTEPPAFQYENVRFALDPTLYAGASGQTLPENPGAVDGPYWDAYPRHVEISLDGYPLDETFFNPVIRVYPVEDFRRLSEPAAGQIDALRTLLEQKPADPAAAGQLPFLPLINAGQVFRSGVAYLDFQNGSGVRFLTQLAQYPAPVNNHELFYTFQGLTADGRYVVSAILPVNHPSLPLSPEALSMDELQKIATDAEYYPGMVAQLSAEPANSFTPNLENLDALVQSLQID